VAALVLAGLAMAQDHVAFSTEDGVQISADLYGKGDRGVVLAHGGQFTKASWAKQAKALADEGFRVLAIDFRGYGQSRNGGQTKYRGNDYCLDVLAAVRYLHQTGVRSVSVVGASFGGAAAAEAAVKAKPGEIRRLVLLASSPIDEPQRIKGRKLFVVSREDLQADGSPRLPKVREQFERAPDPKELLILEGSAHAQQIFATDQGDRLMGEIVRFLTEP